MTGDLAGHFFVQYTLVQFSLDWDYTVLSEIFIIATEDSTRRYKQYEAAGLDWLGRFIMLECVATVGDQSSMRVILEDSFPKSKDLTLFDPKSNLGYEVRITTQRLGQDHGKDMIIDCGKTLKMVHEQTKSRMRKLTEEETATLRTVLFERKNG